MRLVDGEQRDLAAVQQALGRRHAQPLRCDVQKVQLTGHELLLDQPAIIEVLSRIKETGPYAERAERVDLVLHERDQRGDHHADTGADERRDLVAERLAAAGRHQHQRVAAADDVLDDRALLPPERGIAEHAVQRLDGGGMSGSHPAILETGTDTTARRGGRRS
jgi:hypothetical protein